MIKAHPVIYSPLANVNISEYGVFSLINDYKTYQKAFDSAMKYVIENITDIKNVWNPNTLSVGTIVRIEDPTADLSASEKKFLEKFPQRPLLAFIDLTNGQVAGVLSADEIDYDNIVDMYRLFQNGDFNAALGMYELTKPNGQKIPFVTNPEDGHLLVADENGELVPRHSLLDLIYVGFDAGILDRPYLRDWYNKILRGYKDELIDLGLLLVTATSTVVAVKSKNKKVKRGAAITAAATGGYVGFRLYARNKKQQTQKKISENGGGVGRNILFFTSPTCGACRTLKPKVEAFAKQYGSTIINIDSSLGDGQQQHNAAGVTVLPTVVVMDIDGVELKRWDGGISTIESELPAILVS